MKNIPKLTQQTKKRYDRMSFVYDLVEAPAEWLRFSKWRGRFRQRIQGPRVLEVGVGTGKNLPYYPLGIQAAALDLSPRMLTKAVSEGRARGVDVHFFRMDAQSLAFSDHVFDTILAAFVFCSVPDPVQGLKELRRVCKPGGRLLLLEHMRPGNFWLGLLFDALNPLVVRLAGVNINRRTIDNIELAGWKIEVAQRLSLDIVWWIEGLLAE